MVALNLSLPASEKRHWREIFACNFPTYSYSKASRNTVVVVSCGPSIQYVVSVVDRVIAGCPLCR